MTNPGTEQFVPQWAAQLGVAVAKIEARTDEIPQIIQELKDLKANSVSMQEHVKLLNDVETLKERDLGERSDWEDIKHRVLDDKGMLATIWDERAQFRGSLLVLKVLVAILGVGVAVLTMLTLFRGLGGSVSFGGHG